MLTTIGGIELWQGSTWSEDGDPTDTDDAWAGWQADDHNWSSEDPVSTWGGLAPVWENGDPTIWRDVWGLNNRLVEYKNNAMHHKVGERSTAGLVIKDLSELFMFEHGQEVIIRDDDMVIYFGGMITSAKTTRLSQVLPGTEHVISASDYHFLAEKRIFNQAFIAPTPREIFLAILGVLAGEGITEGEIQDGPALPNQLFPNMTCAAACDKTSTLAGFEWWISEEKQLYAVVRMAYRAEWDISDGSDIQMSGLSITSTNTNYRNSQRFTGGKALTPLKSEYFKGDGVRKSWPVGYPLAQVPTITDEEDNPCTVGIKGLDTGMDFYWSEGDFIVTQDDAASPLADGAIRHIQYYGSFSLNVKVDQQAEITRNKIAEGPKFSGIIEDVATDITIQNQDSAIKIAQSTLLAYAAQGKQLDYNTIRRGLACGVVQMVTSAWMKLTAAEFFIYAIDMTIKPGPNGTENLHHQVHACQGPVDPSWVKVMCRIAELGKSAAIQAVSQNDSIQGLSTFTKTWHSYDTPNPFITVYSDALVNDVNFPCLADEDVNTYLVVYVAGIEYYRKPVISVSRNAARDQITTIALLLTQECNDVQISHVGLWGGVNATNLPATGIALSRYAFPKRKIVLESLEFSFIETKGW